MVMLIICVAAVSDPSFHDSGVIVGALKLVLGLGVLGLAPAGYVLVHERAVARGKRTAVYDAVAARPIAPPMYPPPLLPPPPPPLPARLQLPWNRLAQAWDVISELQRRGWVDPDSTSGLPRSMAHLHQLAVADGMTDHLGGRQSGAVEKQINRLADLLVALADEAVEHQAAISAGDYTPATLAAAAERLAADRAAYRELMELSGAWKITDQESGG
ncbi:hypothetical protein ACFVVM_18380 [Nocardia sp. NPDC058176]|uniref:hypothetical protein n=1 Tax=Nocardia sp. NPDC058176 TaxID=3346368 RepID=UPI0036D7D043